MKLGFSVLFFSTEQLDRPELPEKSILALFESIMSDNGFSFKFQMSVDEISFYFNILFNQGFPSQEWFNSNYIMEIMLGKIPLLMM